MRTFLCVFVGSILLASVGLADDQAAQKTKQKQPMSDDMRKAIAFERAKDRADARQAALEKKHPTVFYNQAERSEQDNSTGGNRVPDRGPGH